MDCAVLTHDDRSGYLKSRDAISERVEKTAHFEARQMHSKTCMDTVTKTDMATRVAFDVEGIGVFKLGRIAVRSAVDHHHPAGLGQENATKTRPCYIYGVKPIDGLYIVSVMAISRSSTGARVPVHPRERAALGLPDDCDVVIEEVNVFQWSGPDIVPEPDGSLMRANPASKKLTAAIGTAMVGRTPTIVFRAP